MLYRKTPYQLNILVNVFLLPFFFVNSTTLWAAATEFSGTLETEIGKETNFDKVKSSGISQATVEVNLKNQFSPSASANITLLYEDNGDNPFNVDAAFIRISKEKNPWSIQIGQQYLPFGWMQSHMVSDPLTLELAETSESGFLLSYENNIYTKVYVANGEVNVTNADVKINHFGISFGYASDIDAESGVDIGFDYTNNIGDSNNARDLIAQNPLDSEDFIGGNGEIVKLIPGACAHVGLNMSSVHLFAELVYATDKFQSPEIRKNDAKPSAANVELAIDLGGNNIIAVGAQSSVDMEGFGVPSRRALLAFTTQFENGIGMGLEFRKDKDYVDTGTGETGSGFTLQFSAAF